MSLRIDPKDYRYVETLRLFLHRDEQFQYFMNPKLYIQTCAKSGKAIDSFLIIDEIQNSLRSMLEGYLNGTYMSQSSRLFFPLIVMPSKHLITEINYLLLLIRLLVSQTADSDAEVTETIKEIKEKLEGGLAHDKAAHIIVLFYSIFQRLKTKEGKLSIQKLKINEFDSHCYSSERLKPVRDLRQYSQVCLADYLSGFYLHGSLSTLDHNNYSDLDTLMIVNKDAITDGSKLSKLSVFSIRSLYYLYAFDPLQHHGHIVLSEYDLDSYCQAYFPTVLFNYAVNMIHGGNQLDIHERPSDLETKNYLWNLVQLFRTLYLSGKKVSNLYQFKSILSQFMLLPALYLQAKGEPSYKKDSFNKASKDFDEDIWKIMDKASEVRQQWHYVVPSWVKLIFQKRNNPFLSPLFQKFSGRNIGLSRQDENFYEKMFILSELMWQALNTKSIRCSG